MPSSFVAAKVLKTHVLVTFNFPNHVWYANPACKSLLANLIKTNPSIYLITFATFPSQDQTTYLCPAWIGLQISQFFIDRRFQISKVCVGLKLIIRAQKPPVYNIWYEQLKQKKNTTQLNTLLGIKANTTSSRVSKDY